MNLPPRRPPPLADLNPGYPPEDVEGLEKKGLIIDSTVIAIVCSVLFFVIFLFLIISENVR
jgi:hypothetical protein